MSIAIYDEFNADWTFKGESNDKVKGGALQVYPDYSCIFQLARIDTNVRVAFAPGPFYDESKNVNGKRPVYTKDMPEMQAKVGQVSYGIGDKKLQHWFNVTFVESAIDRAIKFSRSDTKLAKRFVEMARGKNLSEADLKKMLLDKVRAILPEGKGGYDPVLHTKIDWRDPSKPYSTKWMVTRPELLAMTPPQLDESEKLSDFKLYELAAKPWAGCKTIPVVVFDHMTITKGNEIFFKFSTRTVLIVEGTSSAASGATLNLGSTTVSSTSSSNTSSTSTVSSSTTSSAVSSSSPPAAAAPVVTTQNAPAPTPADADAKDGKPKDDAKSAEVKSMAPPKKKSDKPKKSSIMADVDDS